MSPPKIDLDEEDVRLLLLWSWKYAEDRSSFAHRHVKKLVETHRHLFTEADLKLLTESE